jgi:hypothetical protein
MMKMKVQISQAYLQARLDYDPSTGIFTWRERPLDHFVSESAYYTWHSRFAGKVAGSISHYGYTVINIGGLPRKAHRLAWLYVYGEEPQGLIDHKNHIKTDNSILNLRIATNEESSKNQPLRIDAKSGVTGVAWDAPRGQWTAYISALKKRVPLGRFNDLFSACCARKASEILHGYHSNHGAPRHG